MTAQSCGKLNKQQNHFLTNFYFNPTSKAQGIKRKQILILLLCKNTHGPAPDFGLLWLFCPPAVWPFLLTALSIASFPDITETEVELQILYLAFHSISLMPSLTFITSMITSLWMTPDSIFSTWSPGLNYIPIALFQLELSPGLKTWTTFPLLCSQLEL